MALDLEDSPRGAALDNAWIGELYPDLIALPRWCTPRDVSRPTLGGELAEVAETMGHSFMPWQRMVADIGMELDPDGKLHYRVVIVTIHRQGGKTTLILPWEVHRGLAWKSPQRVVYTAQNRNESRKKLVEEQFPMLLKSGFGALGGKRESNGSESWRWNNGSRLGLMSNTKRAGHGATNDLVVLDEAFAQIDWRVEQSLRPTMITRPETQWLTFSTAGDETSVYLVEQVRRGRHLVESGEDARIAYIEFSIPLDADIDDPEVWKRYMPAVGFTISVDDLITEREVMTDFDFRRAYGNQWTDGLHSVDAVIGPKHWQNMADRTSQLADDAPLRLAVDVAPDQSGASLAVAGRRADGLPHLEAIETHKGTSWVASAIREVLDNNARFENQVYLDLSTPAGSLIPALELADVTVKPVTGRDWNAACALFFEQAETEAFRHIDDPDLNLAIASAGQSTSGDGWHWKRRGSETITPLCAVTLALWAHVHVDEYDIMSSFF